MVDKPDSNDKNDKHNQALNIGVEQRAFPATHAAPSDHQTAESSDHKQNSLPSDVWLVLRWVYGVLTSSGFWTAAATIAIAIFTKQLYSVSNHQWTTMQGQLDESRKEFRAVNRPWIGVTATIVSPLVFDSNGGEVTIRFVLKNTGKAVATNVTVILTMDNWNQANGAKEQSALCDPVRKEQIADRGFAIVPDSSIEDDAAAFMDANKTRNEITKWRAGGYKPQVQTFVFGCIDYRMMGLPQHYQTGFNFDLDPKGKANKPGAKWAFPVKLPFNVLTPTTYPADGLELYKWPYGGWYAD